jgi:hypothetical protein
MQLQQGFAMRGIGLNCHFAGQQFPTADVRYGSKADIDRRPLMSALPPKADIDGYLPNVRFVPSKHLREQKKPHHLPH